MPLMPPLPLLIEWLNSVRPTMGSTPRIFPNDAAISYEGFFRNELADGTRWIVIEPYIEPSRASNQKLEVFIAWWWKNPKSL